MQTEDIDRELAKLKAEAAEAKEQQRAIDRAGLLEAARTHGVTRVSAVTVEAWAPGLPTFVVVRAPTKPEFTAYQDTVLEKRVVTATTVLGRDCLVYPDKDTFGQMVEKCAGIALAAGTRAAELAQGKTEEEKKE